MQCSNYGGVGHFAKKIPSPPQLGWKTKQSNFKLVITTMNNWEYYKVWKHMNANTRGPK